jgi:sugar phosphate isomerase/epimerase
MKSHSTRRAFLAKAAVSPIFLKSTSMNASPLNLPLGLQLYTVGKEMDSDPAGTLKQVAAIGYKEVELSPLAKTPVKELRKMLEDVSLKNPSGHYIPSDLLPNLQAQIDLAKELGQEYMISTVPWVADPSRFKPDPNSGQFGLFMAVIQGLTLDDWKWNAEQFNKIGEQVKKAGLQFGYHNHNFEFKSYGEVTGYDELLRLTDPDLVKLEMDCGWVTVAGHDPVAYLTKYPKRYRLLHIKDFRAGFTPRTSLNPGGAGAPVPTELGRGAIDYRRIFAAAKGAQIRAIFVEQEPPFNDMPALEAIKVDYDYLNSLNV